MKKISAPAVKVVAAIVAGFFAVPLTTTALVRSQDDTGIHLESVVNITEKALEHRVERRAQDRRYWRAMNVYREFLRQGETNLVRPDINDTSTVDPYLSGNILLQGAAPVDVTAVTAEEGDNVFEQYDMLLERERDLLDGYVQMGYCPQSLQRLFRNGFYEFCIEYLTAMKATLVRAGDGRRPAAIPGYSQPGRSAAHQTLRERLQSLGDSLKRSALAEPYQRRDRAMEKPEEVTE